MSAVLLSKIGRYIVEDIIRDAPLAMAVAFWSNSILTVLTVPFFMLLFSLLPFVLILITYSLGHLLPALAIMEDPNPKEHLPVNHNPEKEKPESKTDIMHHDLYTSNIRTTIRHLRARGGYYAPFRGIGIYIIYLLCRGFIFSCLNSRVRVPYIIIRVLLAGTFETLMTPFYVFWIHTIISEPAANSRPLRARLPTYKTIKTALPAVALFAFVSHATGHASINLGITLSRLWTSRHPAAALLRYLIDIAVTFTLALLLDLPAGVTMVRVVASLLPADVDTIVPFDRTFNGQLVDGDSFGLLAAWKTFPWSSRFRVLKLVAKYLSILSVGMILLFPVMQRYI